MKCPDCEIELEDLTEDTKIFKQDSMMVAVEAFKFKKCPRCNGEFYDLESCRRIVDVFKEKYPNYYDYMVQSYKRQ